MKFNCDKAALTEAVLSVSPAVSQKSTLMALECVLLRCRGTVLSVIGYNLELGITKDLEVFAGLAIYNNFTDYALDGSDTYGKLRIWQPDQPVYTNSGKYVDYGWIGNVGARVDGKGTSGYDNVAMLKPQAVFSAS